MFKINSIVNIIKFVSKRFAKGFDKEEEFEEWANDVRIKYLVEEDRKPYWYINLESHGSSIIYGLEELIELEGIARKNGFKIGVDTRGIYFDEKEDF